MAALLKNIMSSSNIITLNSTSSVPTERECLLKYADQAYDKGAKFCKAVFDSYLCWPPTKINTVIRQSCPKHRLTDLSNYAYRRCGGDGFWEGRHANETTDKGWTNFTPCFPPSVQSFFIKVFEGNNNTHNKYVVAQNTRALEITGIIISAIFLISSILLYRYKALRNNRTRIHSCLFLVTLVQVLVRLILYVDQAIVRDWNTKGQGIEDIAYLCQFFYIVLEYSISANFAWMALEGLYLHNMVCSTALRVRFSYKLYCSVGWLAPMLLTLIWALATAVYYHYHQINTCWFGYNFIGLYWILQGSRYLVITINFGFMFNIMKTIIMKLRPMQNTEMQKVKKGLKAALFLLPLLGFTNALNMYEMPLTVENWEFALWNYFTHFLRSFQGFFIAYIYCFRNSEVRTVLCRLYRNFRARWTWPEPSTDAGVVYLDDIRPQIFHMGNLCNRESIREQIPTPPPPPIIRHSLPALPPPHILSPEHPPDLLDAVPYRDVCWLARQRSLPTSHERRPSLNTRVNPISLDDIAFELRRLCPLHGQVANAPRENLLVVERETSV